MGLAGFSSPHLIMHLAQISYGSRNTWYTIAVLASSTFVGWFAVIGLFEMSVVIFWNRHRAKRGLDPIHPQSWSEHRQHHRVTTLHAALLGGLLGTIRFADPRTFDWYLDERLHLWPAWGLITPWAVNIIFAVALVSVVALIVSPTHRIGPIGLVISPVLVLVALGSFMFGLVAGPFALLATWLVGAWRPASSLALGADLVLMAARLLEPLTGMEIALFTNGRND